MSRLGPIPACLPQDPAGLEKEFTFRKVVVVGSSLELQSTWKRGALLRPALQSEILSESLTSRIEELGRRPHPGCSSGCPQFPCCPSDSSSVSAPARFSPN